MSDALEAPALDAPAPADAPAPDAPAPVPAIDPAAWNANMPQEMRDNPALADFSSLEALAGSFINTKAMVGRDKVVMPQTDDQWDEVYGLLGRPETVNDYKFADIPDLEEGLVETLKGEREWFGQIAHDLGLSQNQAESLFSSYAGKIQEAVQEAGDQEGTDRDIRIDSMGKEWGRNYDNNLAIAERAVRHLGGDELLQSLIASGASTEPTVLRAFLKIGEMMKEDIGIDSGGNELYSTDQLKDQVTALQNNPAYTDPIHPDHGRVVAQMLKLNERIHGTTLAM